MSVARTALEMTQAATEAIVQRAETRYEAHRQEMFRSADRMFAGLMIGQWIFAIFIAVFAFLPLMALLGALQTSQSRRRSAQ